MIYTCDKCKKPRPNCRCVKRFDENGLPVKATDWTEADWRDLWNNMRQAQQSIAARHEEDHKR